MLKSPESERRHFSEVLSDLEEQIFMECDPDEVLFTREIYEVNQAE